MIQLAAMLLSISMSVFLFLIGYFEALNLVSQNGKVKGLTMIFCFTFGLIFALFANNLHIKIA